jgi:hypothetical protein
MYAKRSYPGKFYIPPEQTSPNLAYRLWVTLKSAIFRAAEFQLFDPKAEGGAISGFRP